MERLRDLLDQPDPPVEHAALALARDAHPELDIRAYLRRLDELAEPLRETPGSRTPHAVAERLASYLSGELGFRGNEEDYYDPRNSYLDQVIDRRTGIPITLTVLWMAIGRRLDVQVEGVGFPGHFLAKVGGEGGVFVDPFGGGRILEQADLCTLAERHLGDPERLHPALLTPVGPEAIVVRMLNNLKAAHQRRGNLPMALLAADRLVELTDSPEHRRDRGLLALLCGSDAQALDDLESYLQSRPNAADAPAVRRALDQARSHGERNLQ